MVTSAITNTLTDPSGTALADVVVVARLKPGNSFRTSDNSEVSTVKSTTTNGSGAWSLTLEENANIVPAGTYYEIEEQIPVSAGGAQVWRIQVGASDATLRASLLSTLPTDAISGNITQDTADARYVATGSDGIGWIDVKRDHGADGDGTTNDTTALQSALDAANTAGGGRVFLPAGTYLISTTLTVYSNTTLAGVGTKSVIKVANSTDIDAVTVNLSASRVVLQDFVIDGNQANQSSTNADGIKADVVTDLDIRGIEVKNTRGRGLFLAASGVMKAVRLSECYIHDIGTVALEVRSVNGLTVSGCHFEAWGIVTAANPCVALSPGSFNNFDVSITGNVFKNTVGTQFAIESQSGSWTEVCDGLTVAGNVFDGNSLGGNGVSGWFFRSNVTGNSFVNGVGTQRSGLELVGQYITVNGNTIDNGTIAVVSNSGGTTSNVVITGNDVFNSAASGSGGIGIQCGGSDGAITDLLICDNKIHLSNAAPQSAVYLGTYADAGQINRVSVVGNTLRGPGTAGNGIRLLAAASSTDLYIANNVASGFANGFLSPANTNHTEVTVLGNDFRGNTANISHAATGGTYRFFGNTKATDGTPVFGSNVSFDDAANVALGTTTGTKIGTATTQKLGFFNATPVVQPAANADTSGATLGELETEVNELKATLRSLGLLAT